MTKLALLFPGQGSQYPGMGKSLFEDFAEARMVFEEADDELGQSLSTVCFHGSEADLRMTETTQPALLTVSIAAWRVLEAREYRPDFVAGHSLGEWSAAVVGGALAFGDAVRLVRNRGRYMQEAVAPGVGAMSAILKLPEEKLPRVLADAAQGEVVAAANFNSEDQVVIAGHKGAVERAGELAKAAGARRVFQLPVSAPFHCELMMPAQRRLAVDLEDVVFHDLRIPLVNNCRVEEVRSGAQVKAGLLEQIPNSVLWTQTMRYLSRAGVRDVVEVGPGGVLNGLLRGLDPAITGTKFGEATDLEKVSLVGH